MKLLAGFILVGHGLVAVALILSVIQLWPPRMGVDLEGGVRQVYAVARGKSAAGNRTDGAQAAIDWDSLSRALRNRLDPGATRDVVVRPCGDRQFEIITSRDVAGQLDIPRRIAATGFLEFRVLANARDHTHLIELAKQQAEDPVLEQRLHNRVTSEDGEELGRWVQAAKTKITAAQVADQIVRNPATGEIIDFRSLGPVRNQRQSLGDYLAEHGIENVDVLVFTKDDCNVTGKYLSTVAASVDEYSNPCINFRLNNTGAQFFRHLTTANRPDMDSQPPFYRHLGIILDDQLLAFPRLVTTISDSGRITGSFTQEEVEFLAAILRSGSLPYKVQKTPVSESNVNPNRTARRFAVVIIAASLAVLVFSWITMLSRYGLVGLAGCLASLLQVVFTLLSIEWTGSTVTMPVIVAAAAFSLFNAVGLLWICASAPQPAPGASEPTLMWPKLMLRMAAFLAALAVPFLFGVAAYLLGHFALAVTGVPLVFGSTVAFLTLFSCVLLPIGLLRSHGGVTASPFAPRK